MRTIPFLLLGATACAAGGCVSREDVSDQAKYQGEAAVYELRQPVYVARFEGEEEAYLETGNSLPEKHRGVSAEHLGRVNAQGLPTILEDVLPVGTRLKVVDIVETKHPEAGNYVTFYVRPEGELGKKWSRLSADDLQSQRSDGDATMLAPEIVSKVAD